MKYKFTKMHGAGNDYIYFNCFEQEIINPEELSIKLSDRNFSIGGDGIILVCPSVVADAKMRMFNLDGSEGKMCGNGIRCVGKFLFDHNIVNQDREYVTIETLSGIKTLKVFKENGVVNLVKVDMGSAILTSKNIPVKSNDETFINKNLIINGHAYDVTCVSMGNPHAVIFTKNIDDLKLDVIGPYFENYEIFPERINTEFVEILGNNTFKMRVWERGSGETLACGTGACAVAVAATLNSLAKKGEDITIKLRGGDLIINYTDDTVFMTGPAENVFEGIINL